MHAHHEERGEQQVEVVRGEPESRDAHDGDLRGLDALEDERLVVAIGELPGQTREQHERQDEQSTREIGQQLGLEPGEVGGLVRRQDHEHVLVDVVVEGSERLGREEGQEATLRKQPELVVLTHSNPCNPAAGTTGGILAHGRRPNR
jgi:hypothetical protein